MLPITALAMQVKFKPRGDRLFWGFLILVILLAIRVQDTANTQAIKAYAKSINTVRAEKDRFLRIDSTSPLPHPELHGRLSYYPVDMNMVYTLRLLPLPDHGAMWLTTNEGTQQAFKRIGWVQLPLPKGGVHPLIVFQTIGQSSLLLPFTDKTTGDETSDLGRYIDVVRKGKDWIILDFNLAYHPYCAYNPGLACPLPPLQNAIPAPIRAGEHLPDSLP